MTPIHSFFPIQPKITAAHLVVERSQQICTLEANKRRFIPTENAPLPWCMDSSAKTKRHLKQKQSHFHT